MKQAIQWASEVLNEPIIKTEIIVEVIYSTVIKITTDGDVYFLKIVPDCYYIEADILGKLKGQPVTPLIAKNEKLKCFLTKSCGDKTLREYFWGQGVIDTDLMKHALIQYRDPQKSTVNDLDFYLQKGVPDWRADNFVNLYREIIRNDYFMDLWDKDRRLQSELISRENLVSELCEQIANYGLCDTLNHCDLHNNNIMIGDSSGELTIIDWAETAIANPILSVEPFFRSLRKHHGLDRNDADYVSLQNNYISKWDVPVDEVRTLLNILGNIYFVFCMRTVILQTGDTFEKWAWEVTGALEDFCSLSSGS